MRVLRINGRIAADAQKQTTQGGTEYITFNVGNNEYGDEKDAQGNPKTHWFRVTSFNPRHFNLLQYLTKGKPINVEGSYSDRIYESKVTHTCEISREILADRIDFEVGTPKEGTATTATATNPATMPKVTAEPLKTKPIPTQESPKVTSAAASAADDVDDLPF